MAISKLKPRHASEGRSIAAVLAKRAFDAQGVKKQPTVKALQAEYSALLDKRKQPMRITSGCARRTRNFKQSSLTWTACSTFRKRNIRRKRKTRNKTAEKG